MAPSTLDPAIVQLYGAAPPAVAEALLATAKELALTVPAARDDPPSP